MTCKPGMLPHAIADDRPSPCAQRCDHRSSCPRVPLRSQLLHTLRLRAGKVMQFRPVDFDVIKFPWLILFSYQLPSTVADGTVAFMLPEDRLPAIDRFPFQRRSEAYAFHRRNRHAITLLRRARAANLDTSCHQIY